MKHILSFFLLFVCATISAQIVTLDTTYITNASGKYYKVHRVVYSDGAYAEDAQLAGDSLQLYQQGKGYIANLAATFASDINSTWNYSRRITAIFRESDKIQALTGRNPVDSLRSDNEALWIGSWNVRGDTSQVIAISKNITTGAYRWRIGTSAFRTAQPIANTVMRLNGYPTSGTFTDFFRISGDRYIQADGKRWLVRPPAAQRSVVIEADTEPAIPSAPDPVVYYSSGLIAVTTGNTTTFKRYSSAKKAWLTLTPAQAKKYM